MIKSARGRVVIVILLLSVQTVFFPLHGQQPVNPDLGVYPGQEDFINDPSRYRGDRVVTAGYVDQTSPLVISVATTRATYKITITNTSLTPNKGDKVRVFGVLEDPRTIRAINAFVVPTTGLMYTWSVSFVGGLWVLVRLIRYWKINVSALAFQPRETPVRFRCYIRSIASREENYHD